MAYRDYIDRHTATDYPAHFIQELTVEHNKNIIITGNRGANISKDPCFAFTLKGGNAGDKITISWVDNLGNEDTQDHIVN